MHADPIGILVCPRSISEEFLFQAAAKADCITVVIYNRHFTAGKFFVCRYSQELICPYCLRAEPINGTRRCDQHSGDSANMVSTECLEMDSGVRIDIEDSGDLIIRSHSYVGNGWYIGRRIELADPQNTVDSLARRISDILNGCDLLHGPYPIDS